ASLQAGNLYGYCMGNPVRYKDNNGEKGIEFSSVLLYQAFFGNGETKDYSKSVILYQTLEGSKIFQNEIASNLEKFINSNGGQSEYSGSISFYGNDINSNDLDLHLAVGKADYTMKFSKITTENNFLGIKWTKTRYDVEITLKDYYNFDEYLEGLSINNMLNNWGYNREKEKDLIPFEWSATFTFKGVG
ncbi:hypothetical protein, partial [uncultured Thomasclavelia sp.]|uniref:hypothetical protein n=1 Tax=uncultured Thomasclavelia sp. TaxID=3025759 RepID=UPI00280B630E